MKRVAVAFVLVSLVLGCVFADSGTFHIGATLKPIYPSFKLYVTYDSAYKTDVKEGNSGGNILDLTSKDGYDPAKNDVTIYAKVWQASEALFAGSLDVSVSATAFGDAAAEASVYSMNTGIQAWTITPILEGDTGTFNIVYDGRTIDKPDVGIFLFTWPTSTTNLAAGEYTSTITVTYTVGS